MPDLQPQSDELHFEHQHEHAIKNITKLTAPQIPITQYAGSIIHGIVFKAKSERKKFHPNTPNPTLIDASAVTHQVIMPIHAIAGDFFIISHSFY